MPGLAEREKPRRKERVTIKETINSYAFFPGCSLNSTGLEYGLSTLAVAGALDLELIEIPDWNCCGASAAHATDELLSLVLPARNLALAEKMGLEVVIPCAGCFGRWRAAEAALQDPAMKDRIQEVIGETICGTTKSYSLLDFMDKRIGAETIRQKAVRPLTGLKVACYYGCLLLRPLELTQAEDTENPLGMDHLLEAAGATVVDWPYKNQCCGGNLASARTDLVLAMAEKLLRMAKEAGAEALVTACPLCMFNLDARQEEIVSKFKQPFKLPLYYFTELIGLSFGLSPERLGLNRHFIDPRPQLKELALL